MHELNITAFLPYRRSAILLVGLRALHMSTGARTGKPGRGFGNGPIENRASSKAKVKLRPVVVTSSEPSAHYCPDTASPVTGSRRTAGVSPPVDVKSKMSMIDPEVASKEPSPSRSPPSQLSSTKRITEAWSIWA